MIRQSAGLGQLFWPGPGSARTHYVLVRRPAREAGISLFQ